MGSCSSQIGDLQSSTTDGDDGARRKGNFAWTSCDKTARIERKLATLLDKRGSDLCAVFACTDRNNICCRLHHLVAKDNASDIGNHIAATARRIRRSC